MYKVKRTTTLPKSLKNRTFSDYEEARGEVRKYLHSKGYGRNLSDNGFYIIPA